MKRGAYYNGNPASKAFVGPPSPFKKYFAGWHHSEARRMAYKMMNHAIRAGMFPRAQTLRCVDCNDWAYAWDHRDYSKPLHVDPVCAACNVRRGPGLNSLQVPA